MLSFLYFKDLLPLISGDTLQFISLSLINASASEIERGAALIFWLPLPRDGYTDNVRADKLVIESSIAL